MKMKDFGFYRGVNLGGWFSQCDYSEERMDHFITPKDFRIIADWGLDHVRIPVDYNVMETEKGQWKEDGFRRIEKALQCAEENGLKVVLDLHKTAGFSFDAGEKEEGFFVSEACQQRFYRLWEEMARRFTDPRNVAFELLNEVTDESFISAWNRIAGECIRRIRGIAPDSLILVGSYHNNAPDALKDLEAPADARVPIRELTGFRGWTRMPGCPLMRRALTRNTLKGSLLSPSKRRRKTIPPFTAVNTE